MSHHVFCDGPGRMCPSSPVWSVWTMSTTFRCARPPMASHAKSMRCACA